LAAGPAGEVYVLPKPKAGFLGREGRGEKREKGDKRRERGGREREGSRNRNFAGRAAMLQSTALRESIAYRLGLLLYCSYRFTTHSSTKAVYSSHNNRLFIIISSLSLQRYINETVSSLKIEHNNVHITYE